MAELLALLAAFAFALGTVLQQKGTLEAPAAADDPRFLVQILRQRVWLAGGAMQIVGWVLQAVALGRGSLIVVQSLTSLSFVIALPLGARLTDQVIDRGIWIGALMMTTGVLLFLSVGQPQAGVKSPTVTAWWSAGSISVAAIALLARAARHRNASVKAMLLGSAAGVCFAMQAAVTKEFVPLVDDGLRVMLASWTVYALIASALIGFALQQSALRTGRLAPAAASSNAITLFGSVLLGAMVFDEHLSKGGGRLVPAVAGLTLALIGMAVLARPSRR